MIASESFLVDIIATRERIFHSYELSRENSDAETDFKFMTIL